MRLALVIVCLTSIAVGLVQIRRWRGHVRNEVLRMQTRQIHMHRELIDQQTELGKRMTPAQIRMRREQMLLPLVDMAPSGRDAGSSNRRVGR